MIRNSIVSKSHRVNVERIRLLTKVLFSNHVEVKQCQIRSNSHLIRSYPFWSGQKYSLNEQRYFEARRWYCSDLPGHTKVPLPALSPTMEKGTLVSWQKEEGDKLEEGDLLAEIETDKATMGFETPEEGYLAKILVPAGTKDIPLRKLLCIIVEKKEDIAAFKDFKDTSELEADAPAKESPKAPEPPPTTSPQVSPPIPVPMPIQLSQPRSGGKVLASPMAKRIAAERGIDLSTVSGTGPGGRVIASDVEGAAPRGMGISAEPIGPAQSRDIQISGVRQVIAKRLLESKQTIPHYYLTVKVNMDALLKARKEINLMLEDTKLSVNDFVIKAAALACMRVPEANSSWQNTFIRQFKSVDMSVAVNTESGLITPIVFGAERRGLLDINNAVKSLAKKARAGELKPEEFQGGTFTITNLGMFGIKSFSAVINPPQACILAVGATNKEIIVDEDIQEGKIANMMTVTLSCDHRVVDGAVGAEWLQHFKKFMENPVSMVL